MKINIDKLSGASILLTGGTGTLGQALVARLLAMPVPPSRLVVFSRDEQKQFSMAQRFPDSEFPMIRYFIGDVRDLRRLRQALDGIDYVIHAAAMKHIHIAEYNPMECIKTNVIGGQNVITACIESGVKQVVALSTDKAAAPINLYGATKLASDKLFVASNSLSGRKATKFCVVRYGNVMGSNGSVIPFFLNHKSKGFLPITDPDMTRFNITVTQAIDLVLYALTEGWGGEIFVPKIPSFKILDLATAIAPECEVKVVGVRPGEKLHEEMITFGDSYSTFDIGSYYAVLPQFDPDRLSQYINERQAKKVKQGFFYRSDINTEWLSVDDLKTLIATELPHK